MAETSIDCETEGPPVLKRRKVRKGTQSCWECKRRKIRCTFVAPTDSICDGCRSRRVKCIGQEFHNEAESANSKADRLDRVEALVEQLAKRAGTDQPGLLPYDTQDARTKTMCSGRSHKQAPLASLKTSIPVTRISLSPTTQIKSRHDELCDALLAVWPSQHDLDLMTSVTVGISVLFHGIVCMPYSNFLSKDMPSPQEMLQPPLSGCHPVLIARKLLMLGSFLQGIPPRGVKDLGRLSTKYREVMSRVVEAASRLVTSNDDLVGSLEGIECIMIESMYQNNAGNLRQAWLTNRRAMAIAQMMGLHLGSSPLANMLDVKNQERIDPECMWVRLVTSDRYLSLVLGLPQGSPESPFATPKALEGCMPMERLERIDAAIGGLILQRNREDLRNLEATHEIDKLLQDTASSMPAQWWLTPDVATIASSDANALSETIRINNQFAHYHLLAQLHLPYMLQSSADPKYNYSKITTVNASREILSRFVHFRGSTGIATYCRGIDFLAFVASTTLCLAHIDARRQYGVHVSNCATVFHFLVHQRPTDRGLMERTLQSTERMAQIDNDVLACKIAGILRPLLAIEAAAANSGRHNASFSSEHGEQELLYGGNGNDDSDTLCINIPHLGTIKVEHNGAVRYVEVANKPCEENARPDSALGVSHSGIRFCFQSKSSPNRAGQQSRREALPSTASPSECQIGDQSTHASWQAVPSHIDLPGPAEESQATVSGKEFSNVDRSPLDTEGLQVTGLAADGDDWALQGVDIALFDSLFGGQET